MSRFVCFGVASSAWLATIAVAPSHALRAAGLAWFASWLVQMIVSATSWILPFGRAAEIAPGLVRLPGIRRYARVARWIHPLPFDRHAPRDLDAAMAAAEATHAVTFVVVIVLALAALAAGDGAMAVFLTLWNVVFNLYPVAVQRRNRDRLRRVARRAGR